MIQNVFAKTYSVQPLHKFQSKKKLIGSTYKIPVCTTPERGHKENNLIIQLGADLFRINILGQMQNHKSSFTWLHQYYFGWVLTSRPTISVYHLHFSNQLKSWDSTPHSSPKQKCCKFKISGPDVLTLGFSLPSQNYFDDI